MIDELRRPRARAFLDGLPLLSAALWWGSLTALGAVVVPLLFVHLPSPAMAGGMAAKLFSAQTWLSTACVLALLSCGIRGTEPSDKPHWFNPSLIALSGGLLLALLLEFAVAPRIQARQDLRLWHSLGTAMLVAQWLCSGWVLWQIGRRPGPQTDGRTQV